MGWRALHAWVDEHNRCLQRKAEAAQTAAESWDNGRDQWWQEQDQRRKRRG